jgi:transposase
MPTGKGERLVMLTAICEEYGIPGDLEALDALLLFQAKKGTGDYHKQMDSNVFCTWLQNQLFPILAEKNIKAILVLDNASYHCAAADNSINVESMTTKREIIEIMDRYQIPYNAGKAPIGDSLEQLKDKLRSWLRQNAEANDIIVGKTKLELLCEQYGHYPPLFTPPYHPELQPIEHLWRDVKQYVSRKYVGGRSMTELNEQVRDGFRRYGTAEWVRTHYVKECSEKEQLYRAQGFIGDEVPADWAEYELEEDDDIIAIWDHDINDDIEEENGYDADGFACVI